MVKYWGKKLCMIFEFKVSEAVKGRHDIIFGQRDWLTVKSVMQARSRHFAANAGFYGFAASCVERLLEMPI
jgi:hypothetical protein